MKEVCAGIVTYNPNLQLFSNCFNALSSQVNEIFIFDNGSKNYENLEKYYKDRAVIIRSETNRGISFALNQLCKIATARGYEWILTMDQDSICEKTMVERLYKYTDNETIGLVAPKVEFKSNGELILTTKNRCEEVQRIRACITSGSLTRLAAWKKVGGYDEWMFIDHVDNEFCTHICMEGYKIIRINSAVLYQRAGDMHYITMPWGTKILLPYYSGFRNYYICRNTIYYLRKYKHYINYKHELATFLYSQMIKLIFENNRFSTIKTTFQGIHDGLKKSID